MVRILTMDIPRRCLFAVAGVAAAAVLMAACSSSTKASSTNQLSSGSGSSAVTIKTATVGGYGKVLVNSSGRTLYTLSSEQGGKVTCTSSGGCTAAWPPTELPAGVSTATAGSGVKKSLLGTAKAPDGSTYVTYGSYPLYAFAGDSGPGQAKGQGITHFGGTWYVIDADGTPVASTASTSTTTGNSSGYGGGY
jgi:predicted lipoprotein with Yx(FWY)xxD motif